MNPAGSSAGRSLLGRLFLLAAFGVAFGHIEAVVVVYIRRVLGWVSLPTDIRAEDVAQMPGWLLHTEQTREAATIILLLAVAALVGRNFLEKLATFLFTFGVWDLTYYAALWAMIRWPESLRTTDCLFLMPQPWIAPVWIPMAISLGLVVVGVGTMLAVTGYTSARDR